MLPPVVVEEIAGINVVRDDYLPRGSEMRYILPLMQSIGAREYVYASPAQGYAQIALAECARLLGVRATVFVAKRAQPHERTVRAKQAGATVIQVPHGYLSNVQAKAKMYCEDTGAFLVPFGVNDARAIEAFAQSVRSAGIARPSEVWLSAGSGTLCRALQMVWPDVPFNAVQVGKAPDVGNAKLFVAPERYEQNAKNPPPFPSCGNYDAKVWDFVQKYSKPGALFWNVGS